MGINSGKFTPPSFGSAPAWCQYEHESTKIVALARKDSPFTVMPSGFGTGRRPVARLPLYLLMGTNRLKMVAKNGRPFTSNVYSRVSLPHFHPLARPYGPYIS